MKLLFVMAILAVGAPAVFGYMGSPGSDAVTPASAGEATRQPLRYVISNAVRGASCEMARRAADGPGIRLQADPACDAVWPGLGNVVALARTGHGTLAMEDGSGKPVLLLAAGDGVAYEAVEPKSAMITVSLAN